MTVVAVHLSPIKPPVFEDLATFIVAMLVLIGSFYGLLFAPGSADVKVIYGGLIAAVSTYYFQRSASKAATSHAIEAQNNGLGEIRQAVNRIEKSNGNGVH